MPCKDAKKDMLSGYEQHLCQLLNKNKLTNTVSVHLLVISRFKEDTL